MFLNNKTAISTYIRTLYSPGFSYLVISFFNTNLSFRLCPYTIDERSHINRFDKSKALMTTVSYDNASFLYQVAMSIVNGDYSMNHIKAVIPSNNCSLILEYRPDENSPAGAFLTINKNNEAVSFQFPIGSYEVIDNGERITKVIQSGLGVFAMTIYGYLTGLGAGNHLSKLPDDSDTPHEENQQR